MEVEAPRYPPSHPDRDLECQETLDSVMRDILDQANQKGWGTVEIMNGMEIVLKHLRLAYAEDPDPEEDPELEDLIDKALDQSSDA
ncbi:hypothetical protein [Pararhizobium qamdonense]|uniref:hypothetical protein n=1 Tax=Pararhizobium qamdonense TaxID=3031126 RepID=UPI0023E10ADB|nr:hypothetical protein [Pararhizobium qamdonense]